MQQEAARIEIVMLADGSVATKFGCRLPAPPVILCGMLEHAKAQIQEKFRDAEQRAVEPAPPGFAAHQGVPR